MSSAAFARSPERVGKYEILLPIASGGMATVYLARTQGIGGFEQYVALKLTHAHLRETTEFVTDLLEEAKLASRIRHRNVVSILDVGDDPSGAFLVMDYVEGDTLAGVRRKATAAGVEIPMGLTARVLVDALAGLHAAHELVDQEGAHLGLVHRDFSPQNLLVGLDGVVKLTDFGVAKASGRVGQTRSGLVKGKIAYMAPEQAKAGAIDRRADVWAAGIVAWEFFSGIRLYPSGDDVATLLKVVTEAPPLLRGLAPHVTPEIEEAVAHALRMSVEERTPTAAAFAKELMTACRASGELFDAEEVAEFMTSLVGPKIAERRRATNEIAKLRARVGQITEATETSATPSSDVLAPAPIQEAPVESAPASTSVPSAPVWVPPPSYEPPTRTDTTSVSASTPRVAVPPKRVPMALVALLSGGAALAVVIVAVVAFYPRTRADVTRAAAASAAPTGTSPPEPADTVPVAAPPTTGAAPLSVHASAPIASLRVSGRAVRIDRPTRDLDVALEASERAKGGRVEVTATDGREARVAFGPNAATLKIDFPAARAGAPATSPPPLAPMPTTPAPGKPATLAPDPYGH
jgi:serine/threonine-protein kinase